MTEPRVRFRICSRAALLRLVALIALLLVAVLWLGSIMIAMPGRSHEGPLPPLSEPQRALAEELRRDVVMLADDIGLRYVGAPKQLARAADAIVEQFQLAGYEVERDSFIVHDVVCENLIAELPGGELRDEIVIVGAHYDSFGATPAANDNASGVAATLALARRFANQSPRRTIRFIAFVNEEPPFFQTEDMGSLVYARRCRERGDNIVAMISLETIGYYRSEEGTQQYPVPLLSAFYTSRGDFIAFVGNLSSRQLLKRAIGTFRENAAFPSQGAALPGFIPGVGWSDQWAFWQAGYPGIMLTDTALYRYPHYHTVRDTPDKIDYESMARVVEGVQAVVDDLANR